MAEQWQLSESEEEEQMDQFDPYQLDPTFRSNEELELFLDGCDLAKAKDSDEEEIDYEKFKSVKKVCTCNRCADIWSGDYEHVCCQQTEQWKGTVNKDEAMGCILESDPFKQATNLFAVRNLLMQMHGKKKLKISDPPENRKMRFGFYKSSILFIGRALHSNPILAYI